MSKTVDSMLMFAAVVNHGSFTKAAGKLGVSKAAVSLQIKQLESRLGIRLLNRSTRTLSLTEAGRGYFQYCQRIQSEVQTAEEHIAELQGKAIGTLKVTCSVNFGSRHIVPAIVSFNEAYPDIKIDLLMNDQMQEMVVENIDVAFRIGPLTSSQLIAKPILRSRYLLCASNVYVEKFGRPKNLEQLQTHKWVVHRLSKNPNRLSIDVGDGKQHIAIEGDVSTDSSIARRQFLMAGLGIAPITEYDARDDLAQGKLVQLISEANLGEMQLYMVYSDRTLMTKKLQLFLEFVAHWFEQRAEPS